MKTRLAIVLVLPFVVLILLWVFQPPQKNDIKSAIIELGYKGNFKDRDVKFEQLTGTMYWLKSEYGRKISLQEMIEVLGNPDLFVKTKDPSTIQYVYFYNKNETKWAAYIDVKDGVVHFFGYNDASVNDHQNYKPFQPR